MLLAAVLGVLTVPDTVALRPGLVLTRSAVVRLGEYPLRPAPGDSVVIRVRGSNIVVDLQGARLSGSAPAARPDERSGYAILIEGGRNITIRNGRIAGYKVGILARGVHHLTIDHIDVSDNWAPRLWSGLGHESLVDWLYYHHNEKDEWLRYGAGIYLADVTDGMIRGSIARGGQNGLLLVRSIGLRIYNNDFSWLSGLGIGLYRSRRNTIMHNRVDWCIRGYVHGVYHRGQDSAALLMYEQSSDNVVAYNSMTHGGDGLFLWAGQSTMDTGAGGANDNLFFGNDFSFAATNGMEATFSRNRFIGNRIEGTQHGLWGGYSYGSVVRGNEMVGNVVGVAIEHGQENRIEGNSFDADETAIRLWWNRIEPSDWGYPKHRDTRSRDYRIEGNTFLGNRVALRLENTQRTQLSGNLALAVDTVLLATGDTTGLSGEHPIRLSARPDARAQWQPNLQDPVAPRPLPDGIQPWLLPTTRQGREAILVDEWGPYDWRYPRLWPTHLGDSTGTSGPLTLRVLGPAGRWRLLGSAGVDAVSSSQGSIGDTIVVTPRLGGITDIRLDLEYVGEAVRAPGGATTAAGSPYPFRYERMVVTPDWRVRVFEWDSTSDPRSRAEAFRVKLTGAPAATLQQPLLDWMWYRPRIAGIPAERFAVSAEGSVELPEGDYELIAISDDGVRVWVDDRLAIDHWTAHESVVDRAPLSSGRHRLRVEYYQVDGWVELQVDIRKR